jgi:hypothetical protein
VVCVAATIAAVGAVVDSEGTAQAKRPSTSPWAADQPDVRHLKFKYGPIEIKPGQNNITFSQGQVPKPAVDGYIVAIAPNLRLRMARFRGSTSSTFITASGSTTARGPTAAPGRSSPRVKRRR